MNNNTKYLKINDSSIYCVDKRDDFDKKLKYEVDTDKLDDHYEDLLYLEDWIPFEILSYLSRERAFKIIRGEKVKNKSLWKERIKEHQLVSLGKDCINLEVESFIRKYPEFKEIFIEI